MRTEILHLLKKSRPVPLSGEAIARRLGVSRTAVWKNIRSLQQMGYAISGSPRRGYVLLQVPDLLYPAELTARLNTKLIAPALSSICHLPSADSTNNVLKKMAEEGAPEGTVVVAEYQETGRGRMGRSWSSPAGKGIYYSLLLRPEIPPQKTSPFTLLAAAAVCQGISSVLPRLSPGIKWPNDVLLNGRKVCGILCEIKAETDLVHYLIIGIGINVNTGPEDLPPALRDTAISLKLANNGVEVPRAAVAAAVLQHFDELYQEYREKGAAPLLDRWRAYNVTLGRRVTIISPGDTFSGTARELDQEGALVVEGEKGKKRRFLAGEVILA